MKLALLTAVQAHPVEVVTATLEDPPSTPNDVVVCPTANEQVVDGAVVEEVLVPQAAISGRMMGAARVKPSPDGVVVDNFASVEVQLTGRSPRP